MAFKKVEGEILTKLQQFGKPFSIPIQGLGWFGKPEATRVIHLVPEIQSEAGEILRDIAHIVIMSMLENKVLEPKQLSHIAFNMETNRYENDQFHITLLNSVFIKKRTFDARELLKTHQYTLNLP